MQITVREALLQASSLLADSGIADGRHEAELMMLHLLGWDKAQLLLDSGAAFPAKQADRWQQMLKRRSAGEPLQYLTGEQAFYGRSFQVTPAVLIPRPETELLVEAILQRVRLLWGHRNQHAAAAKLPGAGESQHNAGRSPDIAGQLPDNARKQGSDSAASWKLADIGTGSGAIAVTLAAELPPEWQVIACDLSVDALRVAEENAIRLGAGARMTFVHGDLLVPLIERGELVDVLVSNPPYIKTSDMAGLQREVRDHEPHMALDGGEDGLNFYRELVRQCGQLAAAPRLVGFEVGWGQAQEVEHMLRAAGHWSEYEIVMDYNAIERHVLAWR